MHPLRVQNFGSGENSRVQRGQAHSQKNLSRPIKIAYIQNQKQTRKRKTENTFVQKKLELTREILNSDDVLKKIYI